MGAKRALIFVNGVLNNPAAAKRLLNPDDYLVAADGGLRHLDSLGLKADLVIGDLDSIAHERIAALKASGSEVRSFPRDKDQTDLELALQAALDMGFQRVTVLAALGGRLDQTLGNILLLTLPELSQCDLRLDDGEVEVFLAREIASFSGQPGDTVSLLPIAGSVIVASTSGLRFALQDETLHPGHTRGMSNEMLGTHAEVRIKSGLLLCVHTRNGGE